MTLAVAAPRPHVRWSIAAAGTGLQLCLGTVYAWSYFQNPLMQAYGWTNAQVAWVFSLAICCLGLAAAWGGMNLARFGPRRLAMIGAGLFGAGYLVAAAALHLKCLPLLYAGYGLIGGAGLGLAYVTPVATVAKWFPDKKGLMTGMVVMGFGFGALLMSKLLASALVSALDANYVTVFASIGAVMLAAALPLAAVMKNPPAGYAPPVLSPSRVACPRGCMRGHVPDQGQTHAQANSSPPQGGQALGMPPSVGKPSENPAAPPDADTLTARQGLLSAQFALMWGVFFCNICAGIAIIGFQSPLMQDLYRKIDSGMSAAELAACGATLIAVSSIFNGLGRFAWGAISDRIGRVQTFRVMLASQVVAFGLLLVVKEPCLFGAIICYILLCYGGGFGTMPSFVLDVFGPRLMATVYGVILTAWAAGGIVGPQIVALCKDTYREDTARAAAASFTVGGGLVVLGLVLSMFLSNRRLAARQ